ncbi:Uncharacterized conserved protein, DUF1015 family [Cyclonatronum proteinivorum]|uniref:Uncharacterized conserved protein, DUF1015 family n=1 Tax=Cyclonatronum proteinivorum TaxID=1457365 RepID=A0A345UHT3_9BACT|nr:DUF1015 family protein [Cyclonatronum proteinivorum]AXJ00035.1 Uncharacterized conserved protein, DUF1015 family [Cyclonatronum proteinivorum]
MITIKPFRAWRPEPARAPQVACVPYDVISTSEARELAEGLPESFLHVIRPEINFPEGTDEHSDEVYAAGAEKLKEMCSSGLLVQEEAPALYVYRLVWKGRAQTGLFTCVSVTDYDNDLILKHELTRPDKEDDRTRHIREQEAHAEPVMLTCGETDEITRLLSEAQTDSPLFDFTAPDGVQHTIWKQPAEGPLKDAFSGLNALYVADGHHRCKSASRLVEHKVATNPGHTGNEAYNFFPAVIFPKNQMEILAYNRVIHQADDAAFARFKQELSLQPVTDPVPQQKGTVCAYYGGSWYSFRLPVEANAGPVGVLDAARLQQFVFEPYFGIGNPRTDANISFIGGIRGTAELEKLVDSGKAAVGFSVYPTSIQELMDVSDAGLLMPPKSTWFEPKLRSGLLVHRF